MTYCNEFKELLSELNKHPKYNRNDCIGVGNPNADILIVGKEASINEKDQDGETNPQYEWEILGNFQQWKENEKRGATRDDVERWVGQPDCDWSRFNPLNPYKGQKFKPQSKNHDGTSPTWKLYQQLFNLIKPEKAIGENQELNFHEHCFVTDLSTACRPHNEPGCHPETQESINARKELFRRSFFQKFKYVILMVGHYPKVYDFDIQEIFNIKFVRQEKTDKVWFNVHHSDGQGEPQRILIHTWQATGITRQGLNETKRALEHLAALLKS